MHALLSKFRSINWLCWKRWQHDPARHSWACEVCKTGIWKCACVSLCLYVKRCPLGAFVKTQAQLWIPSHFPLRTAQGGRGGSAASREQNASLWVFWYFHLTFPVVCVHFSLLPPLLSKTEHFGGSVPAGTMFIWAPQFLDQAEARSKRT